MGSATDQQFMEWAQRIRVSDEDAFADLFRTCYPRMIKFAWRYVRTETEAHDVVQESFVNLWKVRENINPHRSLRAYLYQIVRNRALNYLRDNKNHTSIEDANRDQLKVESQVLANIGENKNYDKKMARLIADLPDRQREAMELSRFEGLDHDEIAKVMNISPRTVNNHIVAALKTLREEWKSFKNNHNG